MRFLSVVSFVYMLYIVGKATENTIVNSKIATKVVTG